MKVFFIAFGIMCMLYLYKNSYNLSEAYWSHNDTKNLQNNIITPVMYSLFRKSIG